MTSALVIGGGPAGLMAAETLLDAGVPVTLAEAKPSIGRKFLMAGKSGLNLAKMVPMDEVHAAYGCPVLRPMLEAFGPDQVQAWAEALGQDTFTGSSKRLFPRAMKASPLLRAWLLRLDGKGLVRHTRWRWQGWSDQGLLRFDTPEGPVTQDPTVTILALGGASWARLGSDGAWHEHLAAQDVPLVPFAPANAALHVAWSAHMTRHFGTPLKNITFCAGPLSNRGEAILSQRGLEGGGIYPLTPAFRQGHKLTLDLFPDLTHETLTARLSKPRGKQSQSNALRKALRLPPHLLALILEGGRPLPPDPSDLAVRLKSLPLPAHHLRPMDEAISTAGGVPFSALTPGLELRAVPGVYCAGEMLDWEAPTGGFLINACLATGRFAGLNAAGSLV